MKSSVVHITEEAIACISEHIPEQSNAACFDHVGSISEGQSITLQCC